MSYDAYMPIPHATVPLRTFRIALPTGDKISLQGHYMVPNHHGHLVIERLKEKEAASGEKPKIYRIDKHEEPTIAVAKFKEWSYCVEETPNINNPI